MREPSPIRWPSGHEPDGAALHAVNHLDVDASAERVWAWLQRPELWPRFYSNARLVRHLDGPWPEVALGSRFRWLTFGTFVTSEIVEHEPPRRLAWTARELGGRGYHAWVIEHCEGGCAVHTEETQRGWGIRLARPLLQRGMVRFHQRWLEGLARAAEEGAPPAA